MKTTFEDYIEANQNLMNCFEKVPVDQYQNMSEQQQSQLCQNEKNEVREILESGKMSFSKILEEKFSVMNL